MIGWVWIVLAVVLMLKALVNLLTVTVLRTTAPTLLQAMSERLANGPFSRWLIQNAGVVFVAQAFSWLLVGLCAWSFLRLRPWARVAMQVICCLGLCYGWALAVLWIKLWQKTGLASAGAELTEARRSVALFAGLAVWILFGAVLAVWLGLLRSSRVRGAFTPARPS